VSLEEEMKRFREAHGRSVFYYGDLASWVKKTHSVEHWGIPPDLLGLPGITTLGGMRYWSAYT